jgi:hypothetical protein
VVYRHAFATAVIAPFAIILERYTNMVAWFKRVLAFINLYW